MKNVCLENNQSRHDGFDRFVNYQAIFWLKKQAPTNEINHRQQIVLK